MLFAICNVFLYNQYDPNKKPTFFERLEKNEWLCVRFYYCFWSKPMNYPIDQSWLELLENIDLGIVAFDAKEKRIVFQNRAIQNFMPASTAHDFSQLENIFLADPESISTGKPSQQKLILAEKTIGFTIYPQVNGLHWILASEISEKTYAQKITENTKLYDMLDYTFFNLTHELGNPINSIKMTLEVLINNFDKYSEATRREYLDNLHGEVNRLEELLKAIKSINLYENLTIKATDIRALLENLLQLLNHEIENKHIAVNLTCLQPQLRCQSDPRALHQVLLNIIGNAINALEGGKDPRLAILIEASGPHIHIIIKDNGCGIVDDKKKELFLPFFTTKPRGIGLGLTIAKKLLTQMNGTIEINSQHHQGTEVLLSLPKAPNHER
jgi:signal transduction histidine kinase